MIQKEDTRVTKKNTYKNKLHGMKKYNNKKYTESHVLLKRHRRANSTALVHNAHAPKYNYMKYWRVVRKWAKIKYEISTADLEILLFLYDEGIWKKADFLRAEEIHSWDTSRFTRFLDKEYIRIWRQGKGYSGHARLYEMTSKSKRICKSIYRKLLQIESIPENKQNNPMYLAQNRGGIINYYKKAISLMNSKREESRIEEGHYSN